MASQIQIGKIYSQIARTQDGWIMMPLDVQGALWSPKFKGRGKQFRDKVIDRLIPQDTDTTLKQVDKEEKVPLEKKLQDTLKNWFK